MKKIIVLCLCLAGLAACTTLNPPPSNFIVFFAEGGSELSPEARAIVNDAASAILQTSPSMVAVSTGVLRGDNLRLAEPRFTAIQRALIEDGVSPDIIARATIPERDATTTVALANQRAEILLFPRP